MGIATKYAVIEGRKGVIDRDVARVVGERAAFHGHIGAAGCKVKVGDYVLSVVDPTSNHLDLISASRRDPTVCFVHHHILKIWYRCSSVNLNGIHISCTSKLNDAVLKI